MEYQPNSTNVSLTYPTPLITQRTQNKSLYQKALAEGFSETISRIIAGREIDKNALTVRQALKPTLKDIASPHSLKDIDKAVDRLVEARNKDEHIFLCIDFDADGQTSLGVLYRGLVILGFKKSNLTSISAHRLIEGYGLNDKIVDRILNSTHRPSLVVTADNGSSNAIQIQRLADNSIDVIVTDHHALLDGPPSSAIAVINPIRSDCEFPDKSIAGCSVAFMLVLALRERLIELSEINNQISIASLLSFCGVGVQADCVHLGKSMTNRAMVRYAISLIQSGKSFVCWDALKALGRGEDAIDSEFLSFTVAPAINAAGRLDTAKHAGDLFLTDSLPTARNLVSRLKLLNDRRKEIEREMAGDAKKIALTKHHIGKNGLSCFLPNGNPGVVGIVASRVTQSFGKPSCVLAPMVEDKRIITGSLRSIDGYNIKDGIIFINKNYPKLLLRGGGHEKAGGLSFDAENLEVFESAFEESVNAQIKDLTLFPIVETDGFIGANELSLNLFDEIADLQPYGQGFPKPLFETIGVLSKLRMVGQPSVHAQVEFIIDGTIFKGIWFFSKNSESEDDQIMLGSTYQIVFSIGKNSFNGASNLQLLISHCFQVN
ncbi:MAG: hypothetical protein CTY35_09830 [Methylotenera sp.]|nr:MAG: hypothetical protein CTY35_09830 [Methylotenera sp.]